MPHDPTLTPTQQEVLDALGATPEHRPVFDLELKHTLRHALEEALHVAGAQVDPDRPLFVNKHSISQIHGCEAKFVGDYEGEFEWSVALARGTVAHRAIEMSLTWRGEKEPLVLVEEAVARLENEEYGLGQWVQKATEADLADLKSQANERVAAFLDCWPPLKPRWRPVAESRSRVELFDGRINLSGKVDLALGKADGLRAGKVLVDLKTGRHNPAHTDDLRFYALLEAIRAGVPPRLLATYYLDQGRFVSEPVTEAILHSTVARVTDGIERMVELLIDKAEPAKRPSRACGWCSLLTTCEEGQTEQARDIDELYLTPDD